jgi:hypothetical protein
LKIITHQNCPVADVRDGHDDEKRLSQLWCETVCLLPPLAASLAACQAPGLRLKACYLRSDQGAKFFQPARSLSGNPVFAHVHAIFKVPRHPRHAKITGRASGGRRDVFSEKYARNCGEMLAFTTWPSFAEVEKGHSDKNAIPYPSRDEERLEMSTASDS